MTVAWKSPLRAVAPVEAYFVSGVETPYLYSFSRIGNGGQKKPLVMLSSQGELFPTRLGTSPCS